MVGFSWSDWSSVSLKVPRSAQVSATDSVELASTQARELKDPKSFNCKKECLDGKAELKIRRCRTTTSNTTAYSLCFISILIHTRR